MGFIGSLARQNLHPTNDIALLVEDLSLIVDLLSRALCGVTIDQFANRLTLFIQDLALFVDLQSFKDAEVDLRYKIGKFLFGSFSELSFANNIYLLVDYFTLVVDGHTLDLFDLAFSQLTKDIALSIDDLALGINLLAFESLDARQFTLSTFLNSVTSLFHGAWNILGYVFGSVVEICSIRVDFSAANNIPVIIQDLALVVERLPLQLFRVTFNKLTNSVTVFVQNLAGRIDCETLKDVKTR